MTKQKAERYCDYVDSITVHGRRSLYQFYTKYSDKKAHAWQAITKRCNDDQGIGLTIVHGNQYNFTTGYIKRVEGGAVLVYDSVGGTDYIPLSAEQRQEVGKLLCLTI